MKAGYLHWSAFILADEIQCFNKMTWESIQGRILIFILPHHCTICLIYYVCTLLSHKPLPARVEQIRWEVLVLTPNLLEAILNRYYPAHANSISPPMKNVYRADKSKNVWNIIKEKLWQCERVCYWSLKLSPASRRCFTLSRLKLWLPRDVKVE